MKIAIIGAGPSGLLTADYLSPEFEITVYEKAEYLGGLSASINCEGIWIEKYNHFFSQNDTEIINVLSRLKLKEKLYWVKIRQALLKNDIFLSLSNPGDFWSFPNLRLCQKINFLKFLLHNYFSKYPAHLEDVSAADWIKKKCQEEVFYNFFEPLLKYKFQDYADISAVYLWARIKEAKHTRIGYLDGGTNILFEKIKEKISGNGGMIFLKNAVRKLTLKENNKWLVETDKNAEEYDLVISSISFPETAALSSQLIGKIEQFPRIKYLSIASCLLSLKEPLSKKYWLFLVDLENRGLKVVIDTTLLTKKTFVYFPVYGDAEIAGEKEEKFFDDCFRCLKKINPDFQERWVKDKFFFFDRYAEPVYNKDFLNILNKNIYNQKGLYIGELFPQPLLLKTLNSAALKSRIIAQLIKKKYARDNSS